MTAGDWIGIGSLASSILVLLIGYLRRPTFLPASRVDDLRQQLADCRGECTDQRERITILEERVKAQDGRISLLMIDVEWYRDHWRKALAEVESRKA